MREAASRARNVAVAAALLALFAGAVVLVASRLSGPAARAPLVRFVPGDRQAYRLRVESTVRLRQAAPAGATAVQHLLAGTLHLRVRDPGEEGARVALQLADGILRVDGVPRDAIAGQLRSPFVVTFRPDGAPARFEFPPSLDGGVRVILEEAVRAFQVTARSGAGPTWTAEESDAAGRYLADYRLTGDGRLVKVKRAYLDEGAGGPQASVRRAEAVARIAPAASWLERMVAEEEIAVSLDGRPFLESSNRAELEPAPIDLAAFPLEIDGGPGAAGARGGTAPAPPATDRSRPRPGTEAELADLVRGLDLAGGRSATLTFALRDLLVHDPAAAARVLALLRAGVADGTAAALLAALGLAATEEAQAALRAVLEAPNFGTTNRERAALALGGSWDVADVSLATLRALADERRPDGLAGTAALSLGLAGGTLYQAGSLRYPGVRDDLLRRVDAARGPGELSTALLALGNTGDPGGAGAALAHLADPSAAARSAAAHAAGKVGGAGTLDVLARRLAVEADPAVRGDLADAIARLGPPGAEALALVDAAIGRERDARAREVLVRVLAEHMRDYPPARATLAALATRDPSRSIRQYATHSVWGAGDLAAEAVPRTR